MSNTFYCKSAGRWVLLAAVMLAGAGTQACGNSNSLYGSVSTSLNLSYDSVVLGVQGSSLIVSYMRKNGEVPAKLAIDTNGLTLSNGAVIDGGNFLSNVVVTRVVTEANQTFKAVVRGSINFSNYSTSPGGSLSGHFAVTFTSGDLLEGDFSGNLVNETASSELWQPHFHATIAQHEAISMPLNPSKTSRVRHDPHADRFALAGLFVVRPPLSG